MTRDELEKRIKNWQFYGEEPDLMTAKLVNDLKYAYLRLLLDHQRTIQDLKELCQEVLDDGPADRSKLIEIQKKYGWEEP